MDRTSYLLNHIYRLWGVAGRLTDDNQRHVAVMSGDFCACDPVFCNPALLGALLRCGLRSKGSYRAYGDGAYWYYVYYDGKSYVIWGPVTFEERSKQDKRQYCRRHNAREEGLRIPQLDGRRIEELITFSHGILFEQYDEDVEFDNRMEKDLQPEKLYPQILEYELERAEWGVEHHTFAAEDRAFKSLIMGEVQEFQKITGNWHEGKDEYGNHVGAVGIMADSQLKDAEYGAVAGITLATRYAIAGGVQENEAYALSDVMLQTLAKAEGEMEIYAVLDRAMKEFGRLGRETRKKSDGLSLYVEQSRAYIAKHIYEKLSLQEIADKIGVHKSYLSRLFSEQMGMTMTEYIMREKVRIACNLLKYSDRSVAMIAEYIQLSPQSYFTKVFKKIMKETPAQYRSNNQDKKFIKS